jgi:SOS-response transcriptional repressor LexA
MRDDWKPRDERDPAHPRPLHRYPVDAELSYEEREQIAWEEDELIRLVADRISRRPDSPDWTDAALLDALTRELRQAPPGEDDLTEHEIAAFTERVRARIRAAREKRAGFRSVRERAPIRPASVPAPPLTAMAEAALEGCTAHIDPAVAAGAGRELWDGECDQWVELPANLPTGKYLSMTVAGDSMLPLLHAGDVILVKVGPEVSAGTVIVARQPDDGYVVKRVGRFDTWEVELLSENPAYEPVRVRRERGGVLGTVMLRWCAHEDD